MYYIGWCINIPGTDRKFLAIGASGCPLAAMATQYCNPFVTVEMGGVFSHSSTASVVDIELKASRLLKYLLCEDEAYRLNVSFA